MDRWDIMMMAAAAYVAIAALVRLMAHRRNELVAKIREEVARQRAAAEAERLAAEEAAEQEAA